MDHSDADEREPVAAQRDEGATTAAPDAPTAAARPRGDRAATERAAMRRALELAAHGPAR
ncbi:hypothetical protein GB864_12035, partial [Agromyces sp. MMS17-SY077]|nr:hypothetical protein [Agromyces seonyuensis]